MAEGVGIQPTVQTISVLVLSRQQRDRKPWETGQIGIESNDPHPKPRGERGEERVAPSFVGWPGKLGERLEDRGKSGRLVEEHHARIRG